MAGNITIGSNCNGVMSNNATRGTIKSNPNSFVIGNKLSLQKERKWLQDNISDFADRWPIPVFDSLSEEGKRNVFLALYKRHYGL